MIIFLLLLLFIGIYPLQAISPQQKLIELRDKANKSITTVTQQQLEQLRATNPSLAYRPIEQEADKDGQPTYKVLTGLSKEQINELLERQTRIPAIKAPSDTRMHIW